jgi:hypothetical protein
VQLRWLHMGAFCIDMARRPLDIVMVRAKKSASFGETPPAARQMLKWWTVGMAIRICAWRLTARAAAAKI